VTWRQRGEFERWRKATELTDEERAIGRPDVPAFEPSSATHRMERGEAAELSGDSLRDHLAGVRDPAEAAQILGRRRSAWYAFCFLAVGVASGGFGVYLIVRVLVDQASVWTLLMLPVFVLVSAFGVVLGYGIAYFTVTGRKWPRADLVNRFAQIVNNNANVNVVPRRLRWNRRP
jgi:hypothetical protein